jgi:AraC-like DNA-binding protein
MRRVHARRTSGAFPSVSAVAATSFAPGRGVQGLRQELRDAAPRSTTVLDRALRWGFWHMGHLARDYKSLFGETPSETLSRRLGATGAKLRTSSEDGGAEPRLDQSPQVARPQGPTQR